MKTSKFASRPRQLTVLELVAIGLFFIVLRVASVHASDLLLDHFVANPVEPVAQHVAR
ncbi:hypothetical protein [Pseudanabaena sp. FACHB-2040]|uniref:hypothetical protein n=1 Tax=Pseudanabaena sp. FACHB-2040 TaxID=2692859 RepID=UPI0016866BE2|nr:hypothetical protein [Pseudanabaena sp. FACHB-2040]MBD2260015.1 hypothetical protein [Pseudanabaena sp. FACHB-2040]